MGTGIITTALIIIVGYFVITKVIGLAVRLVVPVVLIAILGGAGLFADLLPRTGPDSYAVERDQPYGQDRRGPEGPGSIGNMRLRDIADTVVDATRSVLRHVVALLDHAAEPDRPEPLRPYSDSHHPRRDRFGEDAWRSRDDPAAWDAEGRPGRSY